MTDKISKLFSVTAFLDRARWSSYKNHNLINFVSDTLNNDEKLLTHWLCYITDRQVAFKRIWDVGGFIISDMVNSIRINRSLKLLNPDNPSRSFFVKQTDYYDRERYVDDIAKSKSQYLFVGRTKVGENKTLLQYGFASDSYPYFLSRYYPSDFKAILSTLVFLEEYDFSLIQYILPILKRNVTKRPLIPRILFTLFLLTYRDIGQPSAKDIDFDRWLEEAKQRRERLKVILQDEILFESHFSFFCKGTIFRQKRAWCSLRDFFKSPEFSVYFFSALQSAGFDQTEMLLHGDLLQEFELPGDVWNNNSTFRKCILSGTKYFNRTKVPMNRLLRKICSEEKISKGHPEQFDVTFDFVPRMCDNGNCDICPYGKEVGHGEDLERLCAKNSSKFCPVLLMSCGYKYLCTPEDCELIKLGMCQNYRANALEHKPIQGR